eukprot:TRINITY_DN12043_c0_g1_i1.p1 TRINITY_DN12043_c0_g1~~TRINITY_DN12043_c0_g1_i1.p1  ORF type:complete len:218 (-),score=40.19 TRINITY_DN12043_c0_g1_i1:75-728(-)
MSRGERISRYFNKNRLFTLECMQPNGDCFYECVVNALGNVDINVDILRGIVSDSLDDETLSSYRVYFECGVDGYHFMRKIRDLEHLKEAMKLGGKERGPGGCIWADAFCIQTLSSSFNITFLIINENNSITQTVITPQLAFSPPHTKRKEEGEEEQNKYMILQLSRRGHYNLVRYNQKPLFLESELPNDAIQKFNLKIPLTEKEGEKSDVNIEEVDF